MEFKPKAREEQPVSKKHPDYERNLEMAKRNMPRIHNHMALGVNVEFGLDEFRKECFVIVSFTPPRYASIGRIAYIVELYQPYDDLKKEMNFVYSNYDKYAKNFWKNYIISEPGDTVIQYKTGNIIHLKDY